MPCHAMLGACSSRFRAGHTKAPEVNEEGRYVCEECKRSFETIAALGVHRRRCDGGNWKCGWCACAHDASKGRSVGPDGPATLCGRDIA